MGVDTRSRRWIRWMEGLWWIGATQIIFTTLKTIFFLKLKANYDENIQDLTLKDERFKYKKRI
jgi:hypothetical protein